MTDNDVSAAQRKDSCHVLQFKNLSCHVGSGKSKTKKQILERVSGEVRSKGTHVMESSVMLHGDGCDHLLLRLFYLYPNEPFEWQS